MAKNNNSKYASSKSSTTSYSSPKPVAKSSTSESKTSVEAPKKASIVVPIGEALTAEIRKMAVQVWEKKGRPNGKDVENWNEAETIIKKKYGIK
jgi:hypothetical protein